jgi:phosphate transport system substrate-binding protein
MSKLLLMPVLVLATLAAAPAEKVTIKGSNTFGEELAPRLISAYQKIRPEVIIELESAGSGSGIQALLNRTCDLASSSRTMTEDEMRMARSRGIVLRNHTIGYYGVAVVVHPDNPVTQLTDTQVRDMFTGVLTNWHQVGGIDAPIKLFIRDPVSGTHLGFQELAMERRPYAPAVQPLTSYHAIATAVKADPAAIGYVGMTLAAHDGVRAVNINGVSPTPQTVADHRYPYSRQLRFYTDKKTTPAARAFIRFVRSDPGQAILEDLGFVRRSGMKLPLMQDIP